MKRNNFYIDFHVLQTVPPSCVNRDDTGSPKTAVYGGVTRARVSSQAWKHAMRAMFSDLFEPEEVGTRTKRIVEMVAAEILKQNTGLDGKKAEKLAVNALKNAGFKLKDKDTVTEALFFISDAQVKALARLAASEETDKKQFQNALNAFPAIDIALFGRMAANDPSLNYDAAAQVAHSISTHKIQNEYDFFTAVDDKKPEDTEGAGHLGTTEFNSSTLYRYATVNVAELKRHLGKDTAKAVGGFAQAFLLSMPTGKQNSFANRTLPDAVYVSIRRDQPVNCAGAFEKPVIARSDGYLAQSQEQFVAYVTNLYQNFANAPEAAFSIGAPGVFDQIAEGMALQQLLERLENLAAAYAADSGEAV